MAEKLVIVESPAKMKTIKKFLGSGYTVDASMGHVRDLPKSTLGIDVEHDYEPKYITIRGKGELLAKLRKDVKKADTIYLATDPDREGEAISWHLIAALNLDEQKDKKVCRITFNEITKNAVKNAIKHPRGIDMNLVDAQQARRVMDRVVGYTISPLLWEKIRRGLSAGRVQSVALKLISDREAEIAAFVPEEYWTIDAEKKDGRRKITASYYGEESGGRAALHSKEETDQIVADVSGRPMTVAEVKNTERQKTAPFSFTTSTLQQEAAKYLNMSTQKTMRIAQRLYEGVEVKGHGSIGLITYLRTDSVRISDEALSAAAVYITAHYGKEYASFTRPQAKNRGNVQDAHEAIRPTYIELTPAALKEELPRDEWRLYQLIWNRFVASRMKPAIYETTQVRFTGGRHVFAASGSKLKFDGFLAVYSHTEETEEKQDLSSLREGDEIVFDAVSGTQHFTEPPAHYTEASLVRKLEEDGIGRPSTYAPTITTLLQRHYVMKEKKNLYVTELGQAVNEMMSKSFPSIVDSRFTANMEYMLDSVAEGKVGWKTLIENFYPDLEQAVTEARQNLDRVKVRDQETDVVCDKCGRHMVIKYGPHGKFLACPGFPECRNTMPFVEKIGVKCPKCGGEIIKRRTKKGRLFYACENRSCDYVSWQRPRSTKHAAELLEKSRKFKSEVDNPAEKG